MSESVVCKACGSPNRAKAKFCTGCARPLPGFEPSGPSALDPVMSLRLASGTPAGGHAAVPVLPAETAAFWLKAGYWALAMIVGFTLWCLYVTSKPGAPPLKTEIMSGPSWEGCNNSRVGADKNRGTGGASGPLVTNPIWNRVARKAISWRGRRSTSTSPKRV